MGYVCVFEGHEAFHLPIRSELYIFIYKRKEKLYLNAFDLEVMHTSNMQFLKQYLDYRAFLKYIV